jgi:hypothetical protein
VDLLRLDDPYPADTFTDQPGRSADAGVASADDEYVEMSVVVDVHQQALPAPGSGHTNRPQAEFPLPAFTAEDPRQP